MAGTIKQKTGVGDTVERLVFSVPAVGGEVVQPVWKKFTKSSETLSAESPCDWPSSATPAVSPRELNTDTYTKLWVTAPGSTAVKAEMCALK
jgi:hypothetical protein